MASKTQSRKKSSSKTKGFFNIGIVRLVLRVVKLVVIVFVAASLFGVLLFKFVNPPFTWLMIQRGFERKADGKDDIAECNQLAGSAIDFIIAEPDIIV
jgi:monofunctional biosynthetic peptidoglycan transglycosylase